MLLLRFVLRLVLPWALFSAVLLPSAARAQGMPQLDFGNPLTLTQVGWGAAIFIVLYVLLSRFALPRVGQVIEQRARHIAADLETAQAAKARSDAAAREVAEATARARAEAQAAINAALDEANAAAAKQAALLNERLEQQLADAESRIAAARAAAMGALRQVASETAATVIARLTGTPPEQSRLDGAVVIALSARGAS
jgi:F-type H+-transporting ATPase subunit b